MKVVLKKIFTIPGLFLLFIVLINLYFAAYFTLQGEVNFHTDVARDFLLYQEIEDKKIVLIGPRSSTSGLFHGPIWLYLTYPGYLIGQGDPAIMAWYWLGLIIAFLIIGFSVGRSLFGNTAAWIYTVLLSGNMIFYADNLFNPHGALFLIPVFLYSIIRYHESTKIKYLILHLFSAALIIQFQMAVGIPLTILSIIYLLIFKIRRNNLKHLFAFLIFFGLLGNFFLFEVRHNFNMTNAMMAYIEPVNASGNTYDYSSLFIDRIDQLMSVQLSRGLSAHISGAMFVLIILFITIQIRHNKYKHIYLLISYFYVGYILLTFVNKGVVLHHQSLPMLALTNLVFASFATMKSKKVFFPVLIFLIFINTTHANWYIGFQKELFMGKNQNSWIFLSNTANDLINTAPHEYGYFVYSPDSYAYQPHYAMQYWEKQSEKKGHRTTKKPVTYILAAAPPPDRPGMQSAWWIENKARIVSMPDLLKEYPNGYSWFRYKLTNEELKSGIDPTTDIGVFFR